MGTLSGAAAFVVAATLSFAVSYAVENGEALLVSPDDLAEGTWDDDAWSEVWADSSAPGTLDDPWPVGVTVYAPVWDVTLGTPRDATAEILAADPANVPPPDGTEYWVVPVAAYFWGDGSASVENGEAVRLTFVDTTGVEHTATCGAVPGELVTTGAVTWETTLVGSLCVAVPAGADGVWRLAPGDVPPVHLEAAD
ncbi:hypothetical protein [Cellulosimicrobium sp. CUA-896]|uniref:hypothetical protein n=1 Tax=Cellulosimicrobium sp. CUA-896 TaxID=1517881 RepID=UPI000962E4CA|nr:hypothetical protein [Cellulosimicrobium sp. CUA-896]OLT49533.1 hypothetical protein BJF88_15925 [Cellulosimicrobium sp. CUA-896]